CLWLYVLTSLEMLRNKPVPLRNKKVSLSTEGERVMATHEKELLAAVDQLLKDAGAPDAERIAGPDNANELRRQLAEQLRVIGQSAHEADTGGAKVILPGGSHLRVGGTVWPLLTCTVTFVLAPMDPSGLTYAAAGGALVNAFKELGKV